jgi:hypothetical protein
LRPPLFVFVGRRRQGTGQADGGFKESCEARFTLGDNYCLYCFALWWLKEMREEKKKEKAKERKGTGLKTGHYDG